MPDIGPGYKYSSMMYSRIDCKIQMSWADDIEYRSDDVTFFFYISAF